MGGRKEVMELMLGRFSNTLSLNGHFCVACLEVTKTRVNAGSDADVYIAQMTDLFNK